MTEEKIYKILVVDDDEFIRNYIRDVFWIHGKGLYEILLVDNLEEAENIVKTNKPDIILLDLMMPESKTGRINFGKSLDFLKNIKSSSQTKDIKVIVYSGYEDLKDEVIKLGAEAFLIKGKQLPKELVNKIENILIGRK